MGRKAPQPPLPILPPAATAIGSCAGLVEGEAGGVVFVFGVATFAFDPADVAGRRLAAVQLAQTKWASMGEVAAGFGVEQTTLWRWRRAYAKQGVAGLLPARKGPVGPVKLTPQRVAQIRALHEQGLSQRQIAQQTGVSTFSVRTAVRGTAAAQKAAGAPATGGEADRPGRPAPTGVGRGDEQAVPDGEDIDEEDFEAELDEEGFDGEDFDEEDFVEEADVAGSVEVTVQPAAGASGDLVVLAEPVARVGERQLARAGLLEQAPVRFTEGAKLPLAGLLLVLPALAGVGLLEAAEGVYGRLRNGFYGLRSVLLTLVFLALLRSPRAEHLARVRPADLGRLLGLDRAPEVKTLRRRLGQLAAAHRGDALIAALAERHATAHPDALGYLYIDGHVRAYSGTRSLPKAHLTRMRISAPAISETWVNDKHGRPLFMVTAAPSAGLVSELRRLAPTLRELAGDRQVTICFDRGGWSPTLFAELIAAGFDILTYRKGKWRKHPTRAFATHHYTDPDGVTYTYQLAERNVRLKTSAKTTGRKTLTLRQVSLLKKNGGQSAILTAPGPRPIAEVAYWQTNRWRQENFFKYGRSDFALDALDSYATTPDDPERSVPNPAKKAARRKVAAARKALATTQAAHAQAVRAAEDATAATGKPQTIDRTHSQAVRAAEAALANAKQHQAQTPTRLPLGQVNPDAKLLNEHTKLLTHAIRMSTYNAETALARLLRPHYRRAEDEARTLLKQAYTTSGDIHLIGNDLHIDLDPLSAPRHSRALAALCAELTASETCYPGTTHKIIYTVKGFPHPA